VTFTLLLPEHSCTEDAHENVAPDAWLALGQFPLVTSVPLTYNATEDAGSNWLPVLLRYIVVPEVLSMRTFWFC